MMSSQLKGRDAGLQSLPFLEAYSLRSTLLIVISGFSESKEVTEEPEPAELGREPEGILRSASCPNNVRIWAKFDPF